MFLNIHLWLVSITGSLLVGLPSAVALFPQQASIHVDKLEPYFHNLTDKQGNKITTVYFNRGL